MNKIMTNREYIIKALTDGFDDGGATEESTIVYNIACPYFAGDERAHCNDLDGMPDRWKECRDCKWEWLDSEVDE